MPPQRRRRERGSISVDEILNGAFEVATDVSIDNLSGFADDIDIDDIDIDFDYIVDSILDHAGHLMASAES